MARSRKHRRQRGSGSLYRPTYRDKKTGAVRQSGVWWCQYPIPGQKDPARVSTETTDWAEAERFLKIKIGEAQAGANAIEARRGTMTQVIDLLEQDWKLKSAKSLGDLLGKSAKLREYWGDVNTRDITSSKIDAFRAHLQSVKSRRGKPYGNASINRMLAALRHALKLAAEHEPPLILRVPKVKLLKEPKPRQGILTKEQYRTVRDLLKPGARIALVIGFHTGARKGEICAIRSRDVDLNEKAILIPDSKADEARTLPIYGEMAAELSVALDQCGERLVPKYDFRDDWKNACALAGVPDALFHDLRRTACTNMIEAGFSEKEAMQISGHKTRSTFDRYHIVSKERLRKQAKRLEEHLFSQSEQTKSKGEIPVKH